MRSYLFLLYSIGLFFCLNASAQDLAFPSIDNIKKQAVKTCEGYNLPTVLCENFVNTFFDSVDQAEKEKRLEEFRSILADKVKDMLKSEDTWIELVNSSGLLGSKLDEALFLELKVVDVKDADTVLGLEFKYDKEYNRNYLDDDEKKSMVSYWTLSINASGFITQDAEENPRNLLEAKVGFLGGSYTKVPIQPDEVTTAAYRFAQDIDNQQLRDEFWQSMNNVTQPLGGFTYLKYGIDAGFETDQEIDAKNSVISAFGFARYESWDNGSILGSLGIIPSVRVAIDEVNPNSETPRALAGDDSSYSRISGQVSLWMALAKFTKQPYFFGFSYQTYRELNASDIVKNANLETYHLRTFSLSMPYGIVASYSSGRLPFDLTSQQTVELGFKTYF